MPELARYRGDTTPFTFSGTAPGSVAGWTFTLTINSKQNPPDTADQLVALVGVITDPDAYTVEFRPTTVQMDITGRVYYDVSVDDGTYERTLEKGSIVFTQDIGK